MKKFKWDVSFQKGPEWNVAIRQKIVPTQMIIEILETARKAGIEIVVIDYCSLSEEEGGWSMFEDINEVSKIQDYYNNEFNMGVYLNW